MDEHPEGWRLGNSLYVVFQYGAPRYMTITKIGRRWITIDRGHRSERFDAVTMALDGKGYTSPGQVYIHQGDYLNTLEVNKAWADFVRRLSHTLPDHITMTHIDLLKSMVWPEGLK